jgi:hypothetical protein
LILPLKEYRKLFFWLNLVYPELMVALKPPNQLGQFDLKLI